MKITTFKATFGAVNDNLWHGGPLVGGARCFLGVNCCRVATVLGYALQGCSLSISVYIVKITMNSKLRLKIAAVLLTVAQHDSAKGRSLWC
jgi:hypothetical protein